MFVHIYFQKYSRYGFWKAIYNTKIGVWNLDRDDLQQLVIKDVSN